MDEADRNRERDWPTALVAAHPAISSSSSSALDRVSDVWKNMVYEDDDSCTEDELFLFLFFFFFLEVKPLAAAGGVAVHALGKPGIMAKNV